MRTLTVVLIVVLAAAVAGPLLVGCSEEETVTADTAPFESAIEKYLRDAGMGMKVTEFKSLSIEDDTATAVCKMEEAADLYGGIGVRWRFTFRRTAGGGWEVTERETE